MNLTSTLIIIFIVNCVTSGLSIQDKQSKRVTCTKGGEVYQVGDAVPSGDCNTCRCASPGIVMCTLMACQRLVVEEPTCEKNGKVYRAGEAVPSGDCNTCRCSDTGNLICTQMACIQLD